MRRGLYPLSHGLYTVLLNMNISFIIPPKCLKFFKKVSMTHLKEKCLKILIHNLVFVLLNVEDGTYFPRLECLLNICKSWCMQVK